MTVIMVLINDTDDNSELQLIFDVFKLSSDLDFNND